MGSNSDPLGPSDFPEEAFLREAMPMLGALAGAMKDMRRPELLAILAPYIPAEYLAEVIEGVLELFLPANTFLFGDD